MSVGRAALAASTVAGCLVATGGAPQLSSCEQFEPAKWRWRALPQMALGRQGHAAAGGRWGGSGLLGTLTASG